MRWVANETAYPARGNQAEAAAHGRNAMQEGGGLADEAAGGELEGFLPRRRFNHQFAAVVGLWRR